MGLISLQLNVMYAKDLKSFNFFQKLVVYVLVSIDSDDKKPNHNEKHQQRTPTDTEGDGNPEWKHEMRFDLSPEGEDCERLFLHFDLRHQGQYFGDKAIGEVRVPIKDLMEEEIGYNGIARFVSYQVRAPDGKPNGLLHFSCKFVNTTTTPLIDQQQNSGSENIRYPISEVESYPPVQLSGHHDISYPYSSPPTSFTPYYPPPSSMPPPPPPPLLHQPMPPPLPGVPGGYYQPPYPPVFHHHDYHMSRNW